MYFQQRTGKPRRPKPRWRPPNLALLGQSWPGLTNTGVLSTNIWSGLGEIQGGFDYFRAVSTKFRCVAVQPVVCYNRSEPEAVQRHASRNNSKHSTYRFVKTSRYRSRSRYQLAHGGFVLRSLCERVCKPGLGLTCGGARTRQLQRSAWDPGSRLRCCCCC